VAFTAHHGLKNILFATQKDTRKYENIRENPKVALLMDNRVNKKDDFHKTTAITALGVAREVKGARRERLLRVHAARHPAIETFLRHPSCALFNIDVRTYYLVSHFEHVQKLVV
jgi:nitroimidazol reductase NimA-like FMN-containing flavoprotein (pyridoxamine 5'-phosphate oxidase superfamily)